MRYELIVNYLVLFSYSVFIYEKFLFELIPMAMYIFKDKYLSETLSHN